MAAVGVSALAWVFSRAGKVRAFESRVYAQLTNANARIENVESALVAHKLEVTGLTDEMCIAAEKAGKERRRVYAENQRAEARAGGNGEAAPPLANLSREEQVRQVERQMRAG